MLLLLMMMMIAPQDYWNELRNNKAVCTTSVNNDIVNINTSCYVFYDGQEQQQRSEYVMRDERANILHQVTAHKLQYFGHIVRND